MAETFLFNVPAPSSEETAAESVNLYESVDGLGNWVLVDTVLVSELGIDPDTGKSIWTSALSDNLKYHMLVSVSAGALEGTMTAILPPRGGEAMGTVFLNTRDILGKATQGVSVKAQLSGTKVAIGGSLTSQSVHEFTTNMVGYVSFSALQGIKISISCELLGKRSVEIDTTGKATINLAELT